MHGVWSAVEASALASTVRDSLVLTATLSALHVVGFTLIMGSALFVNLRYTGLVLSDRPVVEVVHPGARALMLGVLISLPTGLLSFAPRAIAASGNSTFRLKMLLLVSAIGFQLAINRAALRGRSVRALGAVTLILWLALGLTACAFILLEG